jgi:N-acetylmuramoyl-L-alanine amidase
MESRLKRIVASAAITLALLASAPSGQQLAPPLDAGALPAAIEQALASAPRRFQALESPAQAGVRLLSVDVQRMSATSQRIVIDLSQKALTYEPSGDTEVITDHVLASTARLTQAAGRVEYRLLVDGVPLDQFLSRVVPGGRIGTRDVGAPGRVVVSAGHGWYRYEPANEWRLQRDYYWGIVEDFVNYDIVTYLEAELRSANLDVRPARHPGREAGTGVSGHPRWQESAKYYVKDVGAPPSVWDYGVDDYAKDINSRPFYSNWIDSAVVVSIHNNGGGGTGTETWYDSTNGHEAESRRLAEIVNSRVVAAIRARYDPNWPDRGLRACNGCKGENRLAARPAILVEVAFMDTKTPDNSALHSETFKQVVAQAVREGLQDWGLRAPPPAAPVEDADAQARREIAARAAQDPRFTGIVEGSFAVDTGWDSAWELRWLDVVFTADRRVRVWHAMLRGDRSTRMIGYWDPDSGTWRGWDQVT